MSDDIVARARAALEGVTEGPWEQNGINGVHTPAGSCIATTHQVAGRQRKDDARFIAASRSLVPELLAEVERLHRERREFTAQLGYGDDINEPAATLAQIVEPIEDAFAEAREHQECPHLCESCGERLAETVCPDCHGSGCGKGTALGAYDECEHCAGGGWIHDGCAEATYADLRAEIERLRGALDRVKSSAESGAKGGLLVCEAIHEYIEAVLRGDQ